MKYYKEKIDKHRGFAALLIDYYVKTKKQINYLLGL